MIRMITGFVKLLKTSGTTQARTVYQSFIAESDTLAIFSNLDYIAL